MSRALASGTAAAILAASILAQAQTPLSSRPSHTESVRSMRPDKFASSIQGRTLNSANQPLPKTPVRLRDARHGRILETQVSDATGHFTFRDVEPGTYIVELLSSDEQTVLAASQLISVNAGDLASTFVKLPFRAPLLAGLLGPTPGSAAIVMGAAAAAGVLATTVTPVSASPQR
jgi:Carboxypeptidase regulatory-like domain